MSGATKLHASHVKKAIEGRFESLIDVSDVASASTSQREMAVLTRGLAAFALADAVPGMTDSIAGKHVTDGSKDCGIDALYVDDATKTIYVVQSKWHTAGTGSIAQGDILKTITGIRHLTDTRFDKFNSKFATILPQVEVALSDVDVTIELIIAVTGESELPAEAQDAVDGLCNEMNEISELVKVSVVGLRELRRILIDGTSDARIDVSANLTSWGTVSEPYTAYYGLVDGPTIADWYATYGGRLFDQNLRKALGATVVNNSIVKTLDDAPQNFWYFNNGITALCDKVNKTPRGGPSRVSGEFMVEGISIVNGAQTVSSLAAIAKTSPEKLESVSVWVRLISLEGVPDGFATEVTRTTNTQNAVEGRDFLALDPLQEQLREDMLLTLGLRYVFRRGEAVPQSKDGCSVQEALIALACANADASFAVVAKSNIGRLEDRGGSYYPQLLTGATTPHLIWNAVLVFREVESALSEVREELWDREHAIALQGNRVVTHLVMQRLGGIQRLSSVVDDDDRADLLALARTMTGDVTRSLIDAVEHSYAANYITSLFKNASRCSHLVDEVLSLP